MTSPRTPRQWNAGDEEPPADVTVLRYEHDLPFQFARRTGDAWTLEADTDPAKWTSRERESWKVVSGYCAAWGPLSEVLPETPEPPREDGPRSDAPTLWRRLQVAARVIKAFKPEDPSPELIAFLRDIRDAVDGDLLEDELSGDLMRFARGQGRLLTALLASQDTEERA